ncbi:hypothetical protein D3C79_635910 [compost metagenome]
MGLGQAVDRRRALGHARQAAGADVLAVVQQLAVDLIGDQPQVMGNAQLGQRLPGSARQAGAGGVVRAVQGQGAGLAGDARGDIFGLDPEAVLRAHRHRDHRGATGAEHRLIGDVHGLGDNHFVAGVEHALGHAEQRTLGPGQHRHLIGGGRLAAALLMPAGNGLAQGQLAAYVGVMGVAVLQAVDGGLDDRRRGVEIRVANRQQQHVFAFFQQFQGAVVDVPGSGAVTGDTLGQIGKAHGSLPKKRLKLSARTRA